MDDVVKTYWRSARRHSHHLTSVQCTADMGIGEIAMLIAGGMGTAASVYSMTQGAPKMPAVPQEAKSPTADAFRRKNAAAMNPGAALAASGALNSPGTQNVGTSTLLGQ